MKVTKGNERYESVKKLDAYLREVCADPRNFNDNESLEKAVASQSALAHFTCHQRGIVASSLNALKRNAAGALDGGFRQIDQHRRIARMALQKLRRPSRVVKVTRAGLRERLKEKDKYSETLEQDLWVLTGAFWSVLNHARAYASAHGDSALQALCKKQEAEVLSTLSVRVLDTRRKR